MSIRATGLAVAIALLASVFLASPLASAQDPRAEVHVQVNRSVVGLGDSMNVSAFGMLGDGQATEDNDPPPDMAIVTVVDDLFGPFCWDFEAEEWNNGDPADVPGCVVAMDDGDTGASQFFVRVDAPSTASLEPAASGVDPVSEFSVVVFNYHVASPLFVQDIISGGSEVVILEEGDPDHTTFSNSAFHDFSGLTALEWALFFGVAFVGVILWARAQDLIVEVLGAMLPVLGGLLLLGFGTNQGFGSIWVGVPAMSAIFMLAGIYMMIRVFLDKLGREEEGGLRG